MSAGSDIVARLCGLVGRRHVLTGVAATTPFTQGYRCGGGACVAVVRPGTLAEMWRALQACIDADATVILQAANTGLTGGSTPYGEYDKHVVIISTLRLTGVRILRRGKQVVCLPGTTLHELERALRPLEREPHSVIGSSCIGASVTGGVCNNSGGALVRRGPAYTELALFARLNADGKLELVNHLGIDLGQSPEEMLACLDSGVSLDERLVATELRASDDAYSAHVRDVNAPTPARFNADPRRLFEAAGSAGKVAVFAVRLDTFEPEVRTATFYIGTNAPEELGQLRRRMLTSSHSLPIAAEYMHRGAFDIAERYGKDMFLAIQALGTDRLGWLYGLKRAVDRAAGHIKGMPDSCSDRILQSLSHLFPNHLPRRMLAFRDSFEHHLIIKVGRDAIEATRSLLDSMFPSQSGDYFHCSLPETEKAFRHRFVVAGAAIRYRAVHRDSVQELLALDVALRRDDRDWVERLPEQLNQQVLHTLYYGHFFCHVFHQDYILRKGVDPIAFEHAVCATLDSRGAEYPAEHNVGHLYQAKPALAAHYRSIDPCNLFNPGIGRLSKRRDWAH
jgi:D-lactate dehydrogenase